jgi:hypothetical protein
MSPEASRYPERSAQGRRAADHARHRGVGQAAGPPAAGGARPRRPRADAHAGRRLRHARRHPRGGLRGSLRPRRRPARRRELRPRAVRPGLRVRARPASCSTASTRPSRSSRSTSCATSIRCRPPASFRRAPPDDRHRPGPPRSASRGPILTQFEAPIQVEVAKRIALTEQITPEAVEIVEEGFAASSPPS